MRMITWYEPEWGKTCTIVADETHTVFCVASMLEYKKIKYKVTDRLGLVTPKMMGWGDFEYWMMSLEEKFQ